MQGEKLHSSQQVKSPRSHHKIWPWKKNISMFITILKKKDTMLYFYAIFCFFYLCLYIRYIFNKELISSFNPKFIYLLLFRRFREAGVSGRAASNCRVSFLRAGLSLLSGVLFLWDWYSFSEILLIKTFCTFLSALVADLGAGLLSWVENDTLLFNLRGSVRLRWASSGFFCGVRMDFKGVDFLLMTLDTSEEVVDITETASESSSFINMEATSCASIRRPKNCPVDLRLSIRKSITYQYLQWIIP